MVYKAFFKTMWVLIDPISPEHFLFVNHSPRFAFTVPMPSPVFYLLFSSNFLIKMSSNTTSISKTNSSSFVIILLVLRRWAGVTIPLGVSEIGLWISGLGYKSIILPVPNTFQQNNG